MIEEKRSDGGLGVILIVMVIVLFSFLVWSRNQEEKIQEQIEAAQEKGLLPTPPPPVTAVEPTEGSTAEIPPFVEHPNSFPDATIWEELVEKHTKGGRTDWGAVTEEEKKIRQQGDSILSPKDTTFSP